MVAVSFVGLTCSVISLLCLSSSYFSVTFCSDLDDPGGLAYNWINKRLYFTDYYQCNVQSMGLDGANRSVIATANQPRGIIVDPCYG